VERRLVVGHDLLVEVEMHHRKLTLPVVEETPIAARVAHPTPRRGQLGRR
jgi:hypothetical protein